jgi:hypothetical protein
MDASVRPNSYMSMKIKQKKTLMSLNINVTNAELNIYNIEQTYDCK